MSNTRRDDIYYSFRKHRFEGFSFNGACTCVARKLGTSERAVRRVVVQHGVYA